MAVQKTETFIPSVKFNKLTKEQYDQAVLNGEIQPTEFYLVEELNDNFGDMMKKIYDPQNKSTDIFASIPNSNLLDNSDFTNPVNQRGKTEYTNGYTIDRWKLAIDGPKVTVVPGEGIKLSEADATYGTPLVQLFESGVINENEVYTFSVCDTDGVVESVSGKFTDNTEKITSWGRLRLTKYSEGSAVQINVTYENTRIFKWAKLEKGDVATPWQPKGYGAELAECQRYFNRIASEKAICGVQGGEFAWYTVGFPQMRISPTVAITPGTAKLTNNAILYDVVKWQYSTIRKTNQSATYMAQATQTLPSNSPMFISNAFFELSADL